MGSDEYLMDKVLTHDENASATLWLSSRKRDFIQNNTNISVAFITILKQSKAF